MSEVAVFRAQGGMQKLLVGFGNGEIFGPGLAWLDWDVISGAERLRDVLVRIETAEYGDSTAPAATTAKRLVYRLLALAVGESAMLRCRRCGTTA